MRVAITHATRLEYSANVIEAVMDVRLGPLDDAHQLVERFDLRLDPPGSARRYTDGFGNPYTWCATRARIATSSWPRTVACKRYSKILLLRLAGCPTR